MNLIILAFFYIKITKRGNFYGRKNVLKQFSIGVLWSNNKDKEYLWVDKIQHMRNSIHIFNYQDIGTNKEFFEDLEIYYDFVDNILAHFPPVEEYMNTYPEGYKINVWFE